MQEEPVSKTKIEDLFMHETDDRLSYFFNSNLIISSPTAVYHFFQNFHDYAIEEQEKILNAIIRALKSVSTNGYLLNQQASQSPMRIMKLVIVLVTQNVKNYLLFNLLLQILQLLFPSSSLEESLIKSATTRVAQNLYEDKIDIEHFFGTINIAKALYTAKLQADKQPKNMLMFHGNKGLQIVPNRKGNTLDWKFEQGMTLMFWVYIQNIKFGAQNKLPKLFTFYSPNKGGIESYMIDNKIYYRILGSKYSEPQIGSNGINLGQIEPKKWHFICFQHEGSKVFMKSKLNFYINKNKPASFSIDPPKILKKQETKYVFFDNFYGKASSIGLFSHPIGNQQIEEYNKNINSMENIKKTKAYLFELHQGKLYERSGFGFSPNFILERNLSMNFNHIFPYFYILKFINEPQTYPILNELLNIVVLFFRKSSKNQNLAYNEEYLKLISTLLTRAPPKIYDQNSIKSILHVKHTITDSQLLDQYFGDFLWTIIGANAQMQRKQQIVEIIKNSLMQNIGHYRSVIGFDQMLNYLIKLEPKTISCCQKHYNLVSKKVQSSFSFQSYSKAYRTTINYILQLIELYFQNQSINFGEECYKLCRLLTLKFSPCFILDLISLIKKIISQKLNEKISESQTKKILKYFQDKKIYYIFLHVIENNFFAQIKAESVKMIYQVLMAKKGEEKDELEISLSISKALWKINQEKNNGPESPSKAHSSKEINLYEQILDTKIEEEDKMEEVQTQKNDKNVGFIDIEEQEDDKQFKVVGPMAPTLRNRDKGNKKFDFNFVNTSSKNDKKHKFPTLQEKQIVQEEKTNDPPSETEEPVFELAQIPKKKGKKSFGLCINTEQINQMYTYGGERGQQIVVSEEQEKAEIQKIKRLALICVNAMKKGRGETVIEEEISQPVKQEKRQPKMMLPPPTTSNKNLQERKKKALNLNFINEEEEQQTEGPKMQQVKEEEEEEEDETIILPIKGKFGKKNLQITSKVQQIKSQSPQNQSKSPSALSFSAKKYPLVKSPSNVSPSSKKSSSTSQDNLNSLYSSLLECLLNMSLQTSVIENSIIQVPSVLCIFFKWIPQTDLETKFLNDLDIITEEPQNMEMIVQTPELYDFLFELCYKCIILEELGEKRAYLEAHQNFIKKVYSYIFRQDPAGYSKLNYIMDWAMEKRQEYHPKSLFLTTRYAVVLILQSFQEVLLMNKTSSDKIRERNFQSMGSLLQAMIKYIPKDSPEEFQLDSTERIMLAEDMEMISSLTPYFRSRWIDETACRKYYYLFKKFFSTEWYNKGLAKFQKGQNNFVQIGIGQLQRESAYFLRDNFLISLIQITRCLFVNQVPHSQTYNELASEIIWQLLVVVILSQTNKEKTVKNHRSQRILSFLKNCKFLAENNVKSVMRIIPIFSTTKHFLGIMKMNMKDEKSGAVTSFGDGVLDEIISNYIPEELLKLDKEYDIESFKLHFSDVWVPSQNHYKKLHSQIYTKEKQRNKKTQDKTVQLIQTISNIIEQENERYFYLQIILQADRRKGMNKFRKIWDSLRIYSELWKVPDFKFQTDMLFNKSIYAYDNYEASPYYQYKISKHQSKAKARYFLKLRLNENKFSQQEMKEEILQQKNQIYLSKAIIYSVQNLSIGKSRLNWICDKQVYKDLEITFSFKKVHLINTLTIRTGELGIINDKLIFIPSFVNEKTNHLAIKQYKLRKDKSYFKVWPIEYIKDVLRRRYVNRKRAVQITFIYGKSILLEFLDQNDLEELFKKLTKLKGSKCPNLAYLSKTTDAKRIFENYGYLAKWDSYEMSNFEYLMELNNIAGRSYADTTQYPVMPWVLVNFNSPKLNLNEDDRFRNLQLPMGALGSPERAASFEQRYHLLTVENDEQKKFHYGTHYSSPGILYHFLIRLYPFTEGAILLQGGKFDFADRLFFSMVDSYKNATTEHSDVRQLIPELYTLPEVYLNINKQDLGIMQSKKRVNNVQLPEWARDNPYLYVTKLRKAIQESKVNETINKWIDLIFGYKQKGEEAAKNLNKFFYLTYEDSVDWDSIQNQKQIQAIESQIMNFGQTPSQVFVKPHTQRSNFYTLVNYNYICDPKSQIKVYRPSKNKKLLQEEVQLNPIYQQSQSIIYMKWVKDDRIVFFRRNGEILFYKLTFSSVASQSKVPFQCAIEKQKKIERMEKNESENHYVFDPSLKVNAFPIEFINKGNTICLGGLLDGKLMVIDVQGEGQSQTYSYHEHTISCIKVDTKENFLITGDVKGNVIVWRLNSYHNTYKLAVYETIKDQNAQITSIFSSHELKCFAVSSQDGSVMVYNIITGKKIRAYYHPNKLPIDDVIISTNPLACIVLFSNQEGLIYCYSINGQLIQRIHEKEIECFLAATLLKDSAGFEFVAYGDQKGETTIRAMPYLDKPKKLPVAKEAAVNRVCPSRNGKFLVTGCSDGQLSIITDPNILSAK